MSLISRIQNQKDCPSRVSVSLIFSESNLGCIPIAVEEDSKHFTVSSTPRRPGPAPHLCPSAQKDGRVTAKDLQMVLADVRGAGLCCRFRGLLSSMSMPESYEMNTCGRPRSLAEANASYV